MSSEGGGLRGPRRFPRFLKIAIIGVLAALFGTVAALEVAVRLTSGDRLALSAAEPVAYQPDKKFGYHHPPNAEGMVCLSGKCQTIKINADGLIGPRFRKEKDPGIYRIAVVGDPGVAGARALGGESYPARLQSLLAKDGTKAEVLNFSMEGRNRFYEDTLLASEIVSQYSPDVVLLRTAIPFLDSNIRMATYKGYVVSFAGDVRSALEDVKARVDFIESHRLAIWLYNVSYLVRAWVDHYVKTSDSWQIGYIKAFLEKRCTGRYHVSPYSTKRSIDVLEDLRRDLEKTGGKLLPLVFDNERPVPREAVDRGLQFVTLRAPDETMWEKDGLHWNEAGHQYVAQQLSEVLKGRVLPLNVKAGTAAFPAALGPDVMGRP